MVVVLLLPVLLLLLLLLISRAGFPLGAGTSGAKAFEAAEAVAAGAAEVDMVVSVGDLIAGNEAVVTADVAAVVAAANGRPVKVILETSLLTEAEKALGSRLAAAGGAAFVKTCTGFAPGCSGATAADVELLARESGLPVKASGGVRNAAKARELLEAGATRLGASAGVAIVTGESGASGY